MNIDWKQWCLVGGVVSTGLRIKPVQHERPIEDHESVPDLDTRFGVDEGEQCNRFACVGVMEIKRQYDCSCHISPPCFACVEAPLVCSECDEIVESDQ